MQETRIALPIIFCVTLTLGLAGSIVSLVRGAEDGPALDAGSSGGHPLAELHAVLQGGPTRNVEAAVEDEFPLTSAAITATGLVRYVMFRNGNPGVVIGHDGWLYTTEEFEHHATDAQMLEMRLEFIAAVGAGLARDGVRLLVAIVPSKARIVPEPLPPAAAAIAVHPRIQEAVTGLATRGLDVLDLSAALSATARPFMQRDTHWSPAGAASAATAIAGHVNAMDLSAPVTRFRINVAGEKTVAGDLLSFVPVGRFARRVGLGPETIPAIEAELIEAPTLGLFDLPTIPVTLVGTSFSADPTWGFIASLKAAAQMDVLDISAEAVGPFVPMGDYIRGPYQEVKPELVIWEIPERYLTLPDVEVPEIRDLPAGS